MSVPPTFPPGVKLEYLAEGAANIVYRLVLPSSSSTHGRTSNGTPETAADLHSLPSAMSTSTPPPTEIDLPADAPLVPLPDLLGRLLRLRKDISWIPSYAQLHGTQEKLIYPLFPPEHVVPQSLVLLPPGVIAACNAALSAAEKATARARPAKRHGLYLAEDEPHGLLVTDMSPDPAKGEALIEVKAKWLAQSPNAPAGSKRCRTCALRAMRNDTMVKMGKTPAPPDGYFCPLDLGSGEPEGITRAVRAIASSVSGIGDVAYLEQKLVEFFLSTPILPHLRSLQLSLDPRGILSLPPNETPDDGFLVATTLRDCTLFVKVPSEGAAVGKLGDLDLKAPDSNKIEYWSGLEKDMIKGGWYTATEEGAAPLDPNAPGMCRLER